MGDALELRVIVVDEDLVDLNSFQGIETGPFRAWDRVNAPMIRHWCEAVGETNPIYTDPVAAREQGFSDVVAPPAMLQAWTMYGFNGDRAPGSDSADPIAVLQVLEEAGYPAVVAVSCEQEFECYVEQGDEIYHRSIVEPISPKKNTALGEGFFVTQLCSYYNQRDELVGTMRLGLFQYQPGKAL